MTTRPTRISPHDLIMAMLPSPTLCSDARPGQMRDGLPRVPDCIVDGTPFYAARYGWRRGVGPQRRRALIERDGGRCVWCLTPGDVTPLEIDHIIPISRGGGDEDDNLQVLCQGCNRMKAGCLSSEFDRSDFFPRIPFLWHQGKFSSLWVSP